MGDELFTTKMRKATRKAHAMSDALVNAKLLFALNNNNVWAEGLLVFYEIFKFLENAMRLNLSENLGKLYIIELNRTSAFEKDIEYYLGPNWKKNYVVRDSVNNYIQHLEKLCHTDPDLLMPYVYHLYMGLLSGGQIIRKKRELERKLVNNGDPSLGLAVTEFEGENIAHLKSQLKERMNLIAESLDEKKKLMLVQESIKVFELNNSIVKSVKGTSKIALGNIILMSCSVLLIAMFCYYVTKVFHEEKQLIQM